MHKQSREVRSKVLRKALQEGFFMNAARRVSNTDEGKYLTVNDGAMAIVDKKSNIALSNFYPDWIIYTEISENGNSNNMH
jgi:hypothetical protein